jgi:hypothetical protein
VDEPEPENGSTILSEHGSRIYGLVPVLRPELAMLYGGDPLVGAADQIASNGRSLDGTVLAVTLAMGSP